MQTVVENFQRFQDMPPILALVVQPLVQHVHDLVEIARAGRDMYKHVDSLFQWRWLTC